MRGGWILGLALLLSAAGVAGCLGEDGASSLDEADADAAGDDPPDASSNASSTSADASWSWPPVEEASIRPGVRIDVFELPTGQRRGGCTSNFLFQNPGNDSLLLGTAGHCIPNDAVGSEVTIGEGLASGTIVYDSQATMEARDEQRQHVQALNDFALVRIHDPHLPEVHPAVMHWGGPTELGSPEPGARALTFGNTTYREPAADRLDPREGYVQSDENWTFDVRFAPDSIPGDSGSSVLGPEGQAWGILKSQRGEIGLNAESCGVCNGVVRLDAALAYANEHGNVTVELVTAEPLAEPSLPPQPSTSAPAG